MCVLCSKREKSQLLTQITQTEEITEAMEVQKVSYKQSPQPQGKGKEDNSYFFNKANKLNNSRHPSTI